MNNLNVIVDPASMKDAVIQLNDELNKMSHAKTPQLEHTLAYMKSQVGARRRKHTKKSKKGGKKHKKTRKH
jgi:hypothetical protein